MEILSSMMKDLMVHTVSCDEKSSIQAIATTTDDLRPTMGNGGVCCDYEYKSWGILFLLAEIGLLTGDLWFCSLVIHIRAPIS